MIPTDSATRTGGATGAEAPGAVVIGFPTEDRERISAPRLRLMRSPSTGMVEETSSALFQPGQPGTPPDGVPVEGLRMDSEFPHQPVMVKEVVDAFAPVPPGLVVDGTVGGAGHAAALLDAHPHLRVLGLDRDPRAVEVARRRLERFGERAEVRHARFDAMEREASDVLGGDARGRVSGVLLDLGVSSPQFDRPERGFSYRTEAPLDMRMDPTEGPTAADVVNQWPVDELARLFAANGEGRFARRIARAVVAARPVLTTTELAEIVRQALPAAVRRRGGHPARRVFQALRIEVNDELHQLETALPEGIGLLAPGGRFAVMSYHSGEDRLVKQAFATAVTGGCECPPGLPCACGAVPLGRLVYRGARRPSPAEVEQNHRAESARLRVLERVAPAGEA